MDQRDETLASLGEANDQLMAKNHALAKALSRATQELTKAKAQLNQLAGPPMTFATMVLGKLSALISTIPGPVIGGVSFLLYGMIGTSGIRLLVDGKVDYSRSRNLVLTSVVFVTGLSGIALKIGNVEMTGMVLACVVAMAMSLVFYILDKFGLTNDQSQK